MRIEYMESINRKRCPVCNSERYSEKIQTYRQEFYDL